MKPTVLFVDDEQDVIEDIIHYLGDDFNYLTANSIESGLKVADKNPDIILLDLEFNDLLDGISAIPKFKEVLPAVPVIMLTRHRDYKLVVQAMQKGASDYFVKSSSTDELHDLIKKTLEIESVKSENIYLRKQISDIKGRLIGSSPAMQKVREEIEKAAQLDVPVLILGETGSGKELVAREIHDLSERIRKPFVAINIAGITEELFNSELFGHERGAFTGALHQKKGLFELASNGTLFLDEIGYLANDIQVKLLRVLEEKLCRRVGGTKDVAVPTRILSATNKDLEKLINNGSFRDDLYYRIGAFKVSVPPLRERKQDIPELVYYILHRLNRDDVEVEKPAIDHLLAYHWPGNVRELKSIIEIAGTLAEDRITKNDVRKYINGIDASSTNAVIFNDSKLFELKYKTSEERILTTFRRQYISSLLAKTDGNVVEAARLSGLGRATIYRILDENKSS